MTTDIRFSIAESALGFLMVAISRQGICLVALDDDATVLANHLHSLFPNAQLADNDPELWLALTAVQVMIEQPSSLYSLPLDSQGTDFQKEVWEALRKIPAGNTLSYTELAERIGKPKAVRAVASACAANKLAVVIPCHRVIGKNGGLAGYRWGVERKAELLRREKQQ